jgi:hypothetical protein
VEYREVGWIILISTVKMCQCDSSLLISNGSKIEFEIVQRLRQYENKSCVLN